MTSSAQLVAAAAALVLAVGLPLYGIVGLADVYDRHVHRTPCGQHGPAHRACFRALGIVSIAMVALVISGTDQAITSALRRASPGLVELERNLQSTGIGNPLGLLLVGYSLITCGIVLAPAQYLLERLQLKARARDNAMATARAAGNGNWSASAAPTSPCNRERMTATQEAIGRTVSDPLLHQDNPSGRYPLITWDMVSEAPEPARMHEYTFDLTLLTTLRTRGPDRATAERMLQENIDAATARIELLNGSEVIAEVSIEGTLDLSEVDGKPCM